MARKYLGRSSTAGNADLDVTFSVPRGGTGKVALTIGALLIGAGVAALTEVVPGASGSYLRSNGTTWVANAGVPAADVTGAFTAGLTVSAGVTAVQGLTATTGDFAGRIRNTAGGIRVEGDLSPTTGTDIGLELSAIAGNQSFIKSWNRTSGAVAALQIQVSSFSVLYTGGSAGIIMNSGGTVTLGPGGGTGLQVSGTAITAIGGVPAVLQAVTATALTVSSAATGVVVTSTVGTNPAYVSFVNTGGSYYVGVDKSDGSALSGVPYALALTAPTTRQIAFFIGAARQFQISETLAQYFVPITVTTGTTSVQALTATGLITSAKTGQFLYNATATTGNVYVQLTNTSGQMYLGVESSVGGTIVTGSTAYDTVLTGLTGIAFSANNGTNVHLRIASTGAATFSAGITATTGAFSGAVSVGSLATGTVTGTASILAGALSALGFAGSSILAAPSDGVIRLSNNAANDFTRLQFGGQSNAFPSLRRNGTELQARLADDSGPSSFSCSGLTATALTSTTGAFSGAVTLTGSSITIDNGQFYKAKRFTSSTVMNLLGYPAGSDLVELRTGGVGAGTGFAVVNTGGVQTLFVDDTGGAALLGRLTAAGLTSTASVAFSAALTITTASVTLDNGQYYKAKRSTGSVVMNMIGYGAATDVVEIRTGGVTAASGLQVINTGAVVTFQAMDDGNVSAPLGRMSSKTQAWTVATITYSASMTPDADAGRYQKITATNGTAFTINAPTALVSIATGQTMTMTIRNTSGGALGVATWNAVFKMAAWTQPANANSRSITFFYDGTNWVEINRTTADIPN